MVKLGQGLVAHHGARTQVFNLQWKGPPLAFPHPPGADDWGKGPEEQEHRVEQFRQILEQRGAWDPSKQDYYILLRFLRARDYNYEKALKMFLDHLEWRKKYQVDTIMEDFQYDEVEGFLQYYPQGYHNTDKLGRPIYIQEFGKINYARLIKVRPHGGCRGSDFILLVRACRVARFTWPRCTCAARQAPWQTFAVEHKP